jgi:hypothetical protein
MKIGLPFLLVAGLVIATSHAAILVSDDFSTAGALTGTTPDTSVNGSNWIANGVFSSSGGVLTRTSGTGGAGAGVALGGTLGTGVYNLSATISFAANTTPTTGVWGFGLSQAAPGALTDTGTAGGSPWIFVRENGAIDFRALPSNNSMGSISVVSAGTNQPGTSYSLRLSIDTTAPTWVVSAFLGINGGAETQLDLAPSNAGTLNHIYDNSPTIGYVDITSTTTVGTLDNLLFEGPLPVPEPASAAIASLGFAGLCLRRRRL